MSLIRFTLHAKEVYALLGRPDRRGSPAVAAVVVAAAMVATTTLACGQERVDRVRRVGGLDSGEITSTSVLGLTLTRGGVEKNIPAEEIVSIYLAGEPSQLNAARLAVDSGRHEEALELLEQISADELQRPETASEYQYYRTLAEARAALAGSGELDEAMAAVKTFLTENRTSFHVPAAIELLGDLHAAQGEYDRARQQYAKLGKAPGTYYQMKSALLAGRAWQAEGKHPEALAQFEEVLSASETGPTIDPIRLAATLESAVSRAATGQGQASLTAIDEIIAESDPEDAGLLARAYNALGQARLEAGDTRGALFAFLHVDLLYSTASAEHAEALRHLASLWETLGHPERARQAAEQLAREYPGSRGGLD